MYLSYVSFCSLAFFSYGNFSDAVAFAHISPPFLDTSEPLVTPMALIFARVSPNHNQYADGGFFKASSLSTALTAALQARSLCLASFSLNFCSFNSAFWVFSAFSSAFSAFFSSRAFFPASVAMSFSYASFCSCAFFSKGNLPAAGSPFHISPPFLETSVILPPHMAESLARFSPNHSQYADVGFLISICAAAIAQVGRARRKMRRRTV